MPDYSAWSHYWEAMEDAGAPEVLVLATERRRRVRKPRKLSCGGTAEVGDTIFQDVMLVDGAFGASERCELCYHGDHGADVPPGMHGNLDDRLRVWHSLEDAYYAYYAD